MSNFDKNIILIGMPGCGKTCIGKIISKKLNKSFIDLDEYIEKAEGRSINEIFVNGEEYFRNLESEAVLITSRLKSSIIATGGGVIKRAINMKKLKESGIIFFIDKSPQDIIHDIDLSNRPLLKNSIQNVNELFNQRYDLYKKYCDEIVKADKTLDEIAYQIIQIFNSKYT